MIFDLTLLLVFAATVVTGLLAGASLDKALVQLPARHRMGVVAFASFSRANDLGNGLFFYPAMGILAAVLTILATISAFLRTTPLAQAWPLYAASVLAVLHSLTTTRAAPYMLSLRQTTDNEATLTETFNRFAAWHNVRAVLQVINFVVLVWGIMVYTLPASIDRESTCQPAQPQTSNSTLPEIKATMKSSGEMWALLFFDQAQAKTDEKMVWRLTGEGQPKFQAKDEKRNIIAPIWGPDYHTSSTWNRPGEEWGTGFNFPEPGCWTITVTRGDAVGQIQLMVQDAQ